MKQNNLYAYSPQHRISLITQMFYFVIQSFSMRMKVIKNVYIIHFEKRIFNVAVCTYVRGYFHSKCEDNGVEGNTLIGEGGYQHERNEVNGTLYVIKIIIYIKSNCLSACLSVCPQKLDCVLAIN